MLQAIMDNILSIMWVGMIVVFSIAEFSTAALVSIWFVFGSIASFITSLFTDNFYTQLTVFAAVSLISFLLAYPAVKKLRKKPLTPTNADMMIGKEAVVLEEITPKSTGRVEINGMSWMARANEVIETGELCTVESLSGASVVVKKTNENITV